MDHENTPQESTSAKTSGSTLWKTKEVAAFLNVAESCIRNWVHIGYIPYIKFRGAVRFREEDILEWLNRCAEIPRTKPSNYASRIMREIR